MSGIDFKKVLADAGVPVTEDAALLRLREIAAAENAPFNNLSPFSPFGRLLSLLFAKPLLWLVNFHAETLLPSLYLKTASGKWVDVFAWQLDLSRKRATNARGVITLTRYSGDGTLNVPVGTVIQSAAIAGRVYRMIVTQAGVFAEGQTQLTVVCEAEQSGAAYNLATGFYALVSTQLAGIASVGNAAGWLVVPGADKETDEELKARCRNQFSAVNRWNVDAVYKSLVAEYAGIGINDLYIEHDAPRRAGTANIYVLSDEITPSPEFYAGITARIRADGSHGLGDDVVVLPIPTRDLAVSCRVRLAATLGAAERGTVANEIGNMIRVALRGLPVSTGYRPTRVMPFVVFSWSRLIAELHAAFPALLSIDIRGTDDDLLPGLWVTRCTRVDVEVLS